jgi:hypothetical protein
LATAPERRLRKPELQHAVRAIERAALLLDDELKLDIERLLEEARAVLDLVLRQESM